MLDLLRFLLFDALRTQQLGLFVGAARNFYQVDTGGFQPLGHLQAVLECEAAFLEVGAVELHRHREFRTYGFPDRGDDIQQRAGAVLQ